MSVIATAVKHLLAAGVTGDALVAAIADMEACAPVTDGSAARRREKDAVYQATRRAAAKAAKATPIRRQSRQMSADGADAPPPNDIYSNPPPVSSEASPPTKPRSCGKPMSRKARWPKSMPPPPSVSDEQWAGFIAHRLAKRSPLTDRAYEILIPKLAAEATDEWPPGRIIDEMVERGWLSFKPEWLNRSQDNRNGERPHTERSGGWAPRPGMEGVEPASLDDDGFGFGARH